VLRALAAYDEARRGLVGADRRDAIEAALDVLDDALDADRATAVPALPDESERDEQPHRFGGWL
jgi:hypothetical protein